MEEYLNIFPVNIESVINVAETTGAVSAELLDSRNFTQTM